MSLSVDAKQYPVFWSGLSAIITRLMKQEMTGKIVVIMHQGQIKGVEVDRVYLSLEELTAFQRPV